MNGQPQNSSTAYRPYRPAAALFLAQFSQRLGTLTQVPGQQHNRAVTRRPSRRLRAISTALLIMVQVAMLNNFLPHQHRSGDFLREQVVMENLRDQGFGTIWLMQQEDGFYVAEGLSAEGDPVNIYVDSRSGDILRTELRSILN